MKKHLLIALALAALVGLLYPLCGWALQRGGGARGGGARAPARPTPARPTPAARPTPQVSRPTPARPAPAQAPKISQPARPSPGISQPARPSPGIAQGPKLPQKASPSFGSAPKAQPGFAQPKTQPGIGTAPKARPSPGLVAPQTPKLPAAGSGIAQRPADKGGLINLPKGGGPTGSGIAGKLPGAKGDFKDIVGKGTLPGAKDKLPGDFKGKLPGGKTDFKDFMAQNKDKFPGDLKGKLPGSKDKLPSSKNDWKDFLAKNKDKFPGTKDTIPGKKDSGTDKFPGKKDSFPGKKDSGTDMFPKDKLPINKGDWKEKLPIDKKGGKDKFPGGDWKDKVPKGKFPVGDININNNNITQNFLRNSKTNFGNLNVNRHPEFNQLYNNTWQDRVGWRYNRAGDARRAIGGAYGGLYRPGWWGRYPAFGRLGWFGLGAATGYWWRAATWPSCTSWIPATWTEPFYYDYGGNIVYDNDVVYIQGEPVATSTEFIDQAYQLASTGQQAVVAAPPPTTEKQVEEEWMPLGAFALCNETQGEPIMFLQLTVNKKGAITGSYYNAITEDAQPVYGSIDPQTQRAAWTIGENGTTVMETGVYNLTLPEAPLLVHFNRDRQQNWLMVRMDDSQKGS